MKTHKQKIIDFLQINPEWVDAYRVTNPDRFVTLAWADRGEPIFWASSLHENHPRNEDYFVLPPSGEWQPLPGKLVIETHPKEVFKLVSQRTFGTSLSWHLDDFVGYDVRVTMEAIR